MKVRNLRVSSRWRLGAGYALMVGLAMVVLVQHTRTSQAADNAAATKSNSQEQDYDAVAMKLDPQDYKVMQPVCTRCHSAGFILHSRTWSDWQGIFDQMYGYGMEATQDEWNHIYRFTQNNLTLIDVNHADEDELSAVLGVDEKTAIAIVRRRSDRRFGSAEDLESVPGVNKALVEAKKPRLLFDRPPEE
jgi:hypothetical protein